MLYVKRYARIITVISLAVVVCVVAGWSAGQSTSGSPVIVTNGASNAVPVYAPNQVVVTLDNTPTEPGVVTDVNNPVNDPVPLPEMEQGPALGNGSFSLAIPNLGDPPAGAPTQRYVIEEASGDLKLTHGAHPLFVKLTTTVGGGQAKLFLPTTFMGTDLAGFEHYSVSQRILLYADPGTNVTIEISTTSGPSGQLTFDLAGGFVPVEQTQ